MAATVQTDKQSGMVSGTPFDLAANQAGKGKSRVPEILVGTFLVAVFALAGAWFYSTSTSTTSYVVLRQDVSRGAVITRDQLTTYELNADVPVRGVAAAELQSIIGELALVDLKVGTVITRDQLASKARIPQGYGLVGLDLSPGQFPSLSLRPGDRVRIVLMPEGIVDLTPGSVPVIDEDVEVVEVVEDAGASRFITLALPEELADLVTVADAGDRIRLIQVPGATDDEQGPSVEVEGSSG